MRRVSLIVLALLLDFESLDLLQAVQQTVVRAGIPRRCLQKGGAHMAMILIRRDATRR